MMPHLLPRCRHVGENDSVVLEQPQVVCLPVAVGFRYCLPIIACLHQCRSIGIQQQANERTRLKPVLALSKHNRSKDKH